MEKLTAKDFTSAVTGVNTGFYRTIRWAAVANGASAVEATMKNPPTGNRAFRATHVMGRAYLNAAVANVGPKGAPLARFSDPAPTAAAPNAMPSEYAVSVRLFVGNSFLDTEAVPLPLYAGTAEQPFVLSKPIIFPPKTEVKAQITNASGQTIDAALVFFGEEMEVN